jgi:hypothetical protein
LEFTYLIHLSSFTYPHLLILGRQAAISMGIGSGHAGVEFALFPGFGSARWAPGLQRIFLLSTHRFSALIAAS